MASSNTSFSTKERPPKKNKPLKRLIGRYTQQKDGPLFIVLGGIHGNEYSGIEALNRVLGQLEQLKIAIKGAFVGVAGNISALEQERRFIDKDLNRQWQPSQIEYLEKTPKALLSDNEDIQQKELLTLLKRVRNRKDYESLALLDLHTTSAKGGTYCIAPNHESSQQLALNLPIPVIIGLEKVVSGTTMHYFSAENMASFCLEAGQHENPASADRMEAAIWLTLASIGCIEESDVPNLVQHRQILEDLGKGRPDLVNFLHRHPVVETDEFVMKDGYKNFQLISKGEHLADDKNGKILAPFGGMILMPLYQKQGEDGFFIVEKVERNKA